MNKIASLPTAADSFNDNHLLIETLNKKYNVITKLGKGGFGEILLVLEIGSQKKYAVKKQAKEHVKSKRTEEKVMEEFNMMKSMKSKFIPEQIETFQDIQNYYFVMELMKEDIANPDNLTAVPYEVKQADDENKNRASCV